MEYFNYYLQLCQEERAGLYKGYKYPNLIEVQKASHLYIGQFANVTDELVLAAFRGEEELIREEIWKVARYNGIPFSVLTCPKLIMLDWDRTRHRKMIAEVDKLCMQLKYMARCGNQEAEKWVEYADSANQRFLRAADNNTLTYIHYPDAKRKLSDFIFNTEGTQKGSYDWQKERAAGIMEVLSAAHNIVSTGLENLPEHLRKKQVVYYSDKKDMVVIAGWGENTGMIGEMIADCLELSQEGKEKAEEFCLSSGNDCVISLNEALKEIARIRREKRPATMRIDDIRIYPCFAAHPPKPGKVDRKEWQYAKSGFAEAEIILDSNNYLIDGYIWYLLTQSYGLTHVPVRYGRRQIITAAHKAGGKLYRWELPGMLVGRVHPGDKVKVRTCRGIRTVRVAGVEEYAGEPEPLRMVISKFKKGCGKYAPASGLLQQR